MYRHLELLTWSSKFINTGLHGLHMMFLEKLLYRELQRKLYSREKKLAKVCPKYRGCLYPRLDAALIKGDVAMGNPLHLWLPAWCACAI